MTGGTHLVSLSDTDFSLNTSNLHKVIIKEIYTYTFESDMLLILAYTIKIVY